MQVVHPRCMDRGAILVTGGAKRIGRSICIQLANDGYAIAIHHRDSASEASDLASEIASMGGSATTVQCDLVDPAATSTLIDKASEALGGVFGLVNNASTFVHDDITTFDEASWDGHMAVNVRAPMLLIRSLCQRLGEGHQASVVNILDQKIAAPNPDHLSYTASRYAMLGLTEALARGLAPSIRVNAVAPGHTLPSPFQSPSGFARAQSEAPLGYGPGPEDIAGAVSYLMGAGSVTGQVIFVDSGERFLMRPRDVIFETEGES
ncbi:MAG: short chain dehydrogenase [Euryarchaeota archaeon]|nr:short chain dehydrogenase [Euryarchaeota archaeon]MBV43307.1 short chain dehydrogenase [Euryarchaeota archaeon]